MVMQVIKDTNDDVVAALAHAASAASTAVAPPPDVTPLPPPDRPSRWASAVATPPVPSALRLPAATEGGVRWTEREMRCGPERCGALARGVEARAGGRHVRVELGAVQGWNRRGGSSSLIVLPHGMEPKWCAALLSTHKAPGDGSQHAATGAGVNARADGPVTADAGRAAPATTALLFLFFASGKVLRFQAGL